MNYTINIIDTTNNELVTKLEKAVRGGAKIIYQGGDRKDELTIVGSSLELGIIAEKYIDGYLLDLFTGNETRYKVEVIDANGVYIWNGFILPEEYSEPFTNTPVIDITANDGLGRLKGKYLPDEYYEQEKSIIDIISECLKLTGLTLDIRYSPAIENYQNKDYDAIYKNTEDFLEKDKKKDAYDILDTLIFDSVCVLFQSENCFKIEGVQIREQKVYKTKIYNYLGEFQEEVEITRSQKSIKGIATPEIKMHPPVGILTVSREKELFALPEGLSKEKNNGWSYVMEGIVSPTNTSMTEKDNVIYATDWFGQFGHHAYSGIGDKVFFSYASASNPEPNQRMDLNYRPYVRAGKKYKLIFSFEIETISDDEGINQGYINNKDWENPFEYSASIFSWDPNEFDKIVGNDISSQRPEYLPVNFGLAENKECTIELNFIPKRSGDFMFTLQPLKGFIGINAVNINKLSLELIDEEDEIVITGQVAEDWTTKKEIELEYGSDVNGDGFRLKKLKEPNTLEEITQDIIREFDYKGEHFLSLTLSMANLVDENRDEVYRFSDITGKIPLEIIDVIYNYNNSDEHVALVAGDLGIFNNEITVNKYNYGFVLEDRDYWEEWTDSLFKIERKTYEQTVYNIYERLLDIELPSILGFTVKNNVRFDDIILFDWKDTKEWTITDLVWNLDTGFSEVSMTERYYVSKGQYNPVVDAGDEYYTPDKAVQLYSEAYDPDGFIVSYFWEELTDNQGSLAWFNMQNPIFILGDNNYYAKLRVTVTDNDGNTASDEVEVYRRNDVEITFENIFLDNVEAHYKMVITPELQANTALNIRGKIVANMSWVTVNDSGTPYCDVYVRQNGIVQSQVYNSEQVTAGAIGYKIQFKEFSINYIAGDEIIVELNAPYLLSQSIYNVSATLKFADYIDGFGSVTITDDRVEFERVDT